MIQTIMFETIMIHQIPYQHIADDDTDKKWINSWNLCMKMANYSTSLFNIPVCGIIDFSSVL